MEEEAQKVLKSLIESSPRIKYFPYAYIPESYIRSLCNQVTQIFLNEESVLTLEPPITVCGDTHGQFADTLRILNVIGAPPEKRFLFLGDYVDRGAQSIENIVLLLTLKLCYPKQFFLLRGNHETEEISTVYGLRDECIRRFSFSLYSEFIAVFEAMPFAATIGGSIFCVHGGISSESFTLDDLKNIKRPLNPSDSTIVTDLLWSDPNKDVNGFVPSPRGVSFLFGKKETENFLKNNMLSLIIRSHEFCTEGVLFPFGENGGVVTVFSAANYCGSMNSSAVLTVGENLLCHFTVFHINEATEE